MNIFQNCEVFPKSMNFSKNSGSFFLETYELFRIYVFSNINNQLIHGQLVQGQPVNQA